MDRALVRAFSLLYNPAMSFPVGFALAILLIGTIHPAAAQPSGRTASAPVGASMAVLATLQDAGVLPPEGTAEANRAIQVVIQFQSVFMKSSDAAVEEFRTGALTRRWPTQADEIAAQFRSGGWTSEVLEAFVDQYAGLQTDQRARLNGAFSQANMRQADFEFLSELFERARAAFRRQDRNIHEIFTAHRKTMPGKDRQNRKERHHGDQSVYSHQGQSGTNERRAAVSQEADRS